MEASGSTPNPPPEDRPTTAPATQTAPTPPPPPPPDAREDDKAGGGWRFLGLVLALALAFACAVLVIAMADIGDTPTCEDVLSGEVAPPSDNECFDGSSGQKTASLVLGWPSGILAGIAALVALYFVFTGRRGRLLLQLTGAAVVLGALSIGIGSV
jgi:hypothetical protein